MPQRNPPNWAAWAMAGAAVAITLAVAGIAGLL